jgi:hypothetical protein
MGSAAVLLGSFLLAGDTSLSQEQLDLLHDPHGWEFVAVFDKHNGFPMHHQCFAEGEPKPSECRGTLVLRGDSTFSETIFMHGFTASRHGTYDLDGGQITLIDEFGTKDGPYNLEINTANKTMRYSANQGGVLIGADFDLVDKSKRDSAKHKNESPP